MIASSGPEVRPHNKVILVGDTSVGKTSLLSQFSLHKFESRPESTIGGAFFSTTVETPRGRTLLQIWDTAGQERYRSLIPMYARHSSAAILVGDVTSPPSFAALDNWLAIVRSTCENDDIKVYVVANKTDLQALVNIQNFEDWARARDFKFFATSAMRNETVQPLFITVAKDLAELGRAAQTQLGDLETGGRQTNCC
jgi:small GTP-binding protein